MDTSNIQPSLAQSLSGIEDYSIIDRLSNESKFVGHSTRHIVHEALVPRLVSKDAATPGNSTRLTEANIRSLNALGQGVADAPNRASNMKLKYDILEQSRKNWQPIISQIKEAKLDVNAALPGPERTLLHEASHQGNLEIVKKLIDLGADLSAKTCYGFNALHWASMGGHLEVSQYLVDEVKFNIAKCTNNKGQDALSISEQWIEMEDDAIKKENYKKLSDWLKVRKSSITNKDRLR